MNFRDLDRAIYLRKKKQNLEDASYNKSSFLREGEKKRSRDENESKNSLEQEVESSKLFLSQMKSQKNSRTGRWSSEEVAFVDNLVFSFDQGYLPLPHGVKLNEFLGDMLLCKSSRLTKKMRNAKLSTRSYTLQNILNGTPNEVCLSLSALQENFLQSISSEPMHLEIRFNMTKLWRTHFSNLCIQVGYELLNANDWLTSLEEMERRAAAAEEVVRKARRRRIGLALRQDVGQNANAGVFIAGLSARNADILPFPSSTTSSNLLIAPTNNQKASSTVNAEPLKLKSDAAGTASKLNEETVDFLTNALDEAPPGSRIRTFSEDFSICIRDLTDPLAMVPPAKKTPNNKLNDYGPFVEKIICYIEMHNLPFQHVDVWVPSYSQGQKPKSVDKTSSEEGLRLYYAGHMSRSDIDPQLLLQFQEFGVYSTHFSFAPGMGIPGRIYLSGEPAWDDNIEVAEPHHFDRIGGAKVYGIRTVVGIPLATPVVGRIILLLYSNCRVPHDKDQLQLYCKDFDKWIPEPRWKLVIELGCDSEDDQGQAKQNAKKCEVLNISKAFTKGREENFLSQTTDSLKPESKLQVEEEEQCIVTLLGHQMPLTENHPSSSMVQHFMSLRLLLLRSPDRRTYNEQESLNVIRKSYHGYSQDNSRTDSELASLLVRDWIFLSSANQVIPNQQVTSLPVHSGQAPYKCHIMQPTNLRTELSAGVPTVMPSALVTSGLPIAANQNTLLSAGQSHIFALPSTSLEAGGPIKLIHRRHSIEEQTTKP